MTTPPPDIPNVHGGPGSYSEKALKEYGDARVREALEAAAVKAHYAEGRGESILGICRAIRALMPAAAIAKEGNHVHG